MNNTLISVSDPLNIWPQNNKQILYYLTQFYQTPDLEKTLSVPTVVKTQIIFTKTILALQNIISPKKKVYLKMESYFVYTHQPEFFKGILLLEKEM